MKRILAVNLYLDRQRKLRFNRLLSRVKGLGVEVTATNQEDLPGSDPSLLADSYDGIILSGTEALLTRTADRKQFENLFTYLPRIKAPILGIFSRKT
jgi:hypothetical protein